MRFTCSDLDRNAGYGNKHADKHSDASCDCNGDGITLAWKLLI